MRPRLHYTLGNLYVLLPKEICLLRSGKSFLAPPRERILHRHSFITGFRSRMVVAAIHSPTVYHL